MVTFRMYLNSNLLAWVICFECRSLFSGEFFFIILVIHWFCRRDYYPSLWLQVSSFKFQVKFQVFKFCIVKGVALLSARSSDSSLLFSLVFFCWNRGATRPILSVQQLELLTHWKRDGQEVRSNLSWSGSSAVLNLSWSGSRAILSPRAIRFGIISMARCSCLISWKAVFPQGSLRSCFSAQRNLLVLKQ